MSRMEWLESLAPEEARHRILTLCGVLPPEIRAAVTSCCGASDAGDAGGVAAGAAADDGRRCSAGQGEGAPAGAGACRCADVGTWRRSWRAEACNSDDQT